MMRSSASGVSFGGSSGIGSQPTGGDPGGEIKKFLSIVGGLRWYGENLDFVPVGDDDPDDEGIGVGSARYTRKITSGLHDTVSAPNKNIITKALTFQTWLQGSSHPNPTSRFQRRLHCSKPE